MTPTYSYYRTASTTDDFTALVDGLRGLKGDAVWRGKPEAERAFEQALELLDKAQAALNTSPLDGPAQRKLRGMLEKAVEHDHRRSVQRIIIRGQVSMTYFRQDFPKYPPDDDGEGDREYRKKVVEEERYMTATVSTVMRRFMPADEFNVDVYHQEKGYFDVVVTFKKFP